MIDAQPIAPSLVVTAPESMRGQGFVLTSEQLTIGRAIENDVRIDDPHVSRRHAVIRQSNGVVTVEDAQSSSGVIVNNLRVTGPRVLHAGDRVRLGSVELELNGSGASPSEAPSPGETARPARSELVLRLEPMRRRARRVMAGGIVLVLAGLIVAAVGYAKWVSPILTCLSQAQNDMTPVTSCIDPAGIVITAIGGLLTTAGTITVVVSLFMKRGVQRELAR